MLREIETGAVKHTFEHEDDVVSAIALVSGWAAAADDDADDAADDADDDAVPGVPEFGGARLFIPWTRILVLANAQKAGNFGPCGDGQQAIELVCLKELQPRVDVRRPVPCAMAMTAEAGAKHKRSVEFKSKVVVIVPHITMRATSASSL